MGLFDKIKDLFMDEIVEDEEIELEEENKNIYEEPKNVLPKVMRDTIKREEKREEVKRPVLEVKEEKKEVVEPAKKFTFPIDFGDELPSRNTKNSSVNVLKAEKEVPKKVAELYPKKEEVKTKPKFKATPVISPVYGILDKNYKKEEVKEKSDEISMKRPSKKVDFETVRKKAFGNLVDEIKDNMLCENCELYKEVKRISSIKEDGLLYDMMVDDEDDGDVTIEKAYDNYEEFGVAYEPKVEPRINNNNNQIVEEKEVEEEVNVEDLKLDTEKVEEKDEVIEEVPSRSKKSEEKKETKVDADFFELIDSMYKERSDD